MALFFSIASLMLSVCIGATFPASVFGPESPQPVIKETGPQATRQATTRDGIVRKIFILEGPD